MIKQYTLSLLAACAFTSLYAQPANDECGTAMHADVAATCMPMDQDAAEATQSMAPIPCGGWEADQANDLWYHVIGTGEQITFQATGTGDVDVVMELFSGPCADLTSADCSDATYADGGTEEVAFTSVLGADYHLRVYPYLTTHDDYAYTVCAIGAGSTAGIAERDALAMQLLPNPSNGDLTVATAAPNTRVQLEVADVAGRLVHADQRSTDGNGRLELLLAKTLHPGTYVLRMTSPTGASVRQFVVR